MSDTRDLLRRTAEIAADYVKHRRQFGRSLGEFQAVAHPLAAAGFSPGSQPKAEAAQSAQATQSPKAAAAVTPAWTTYHLDNARTGNDTTEGNVAGASLAWTATNALGSSTLDGQVYASPLVYGTSVYVVTENNTVYAFSTADGTYQWSVHLDTPRASSGLPCGNISPNVGITGTPVIDIAAASGDGIIFMAGMTSEPHYRLYGVDLVTHAVVSNTIIDIGHIAAAPDSFGIFPAGTRRVIPMRISRKRSPCGCAQVHVGAPATPNGRSRSQSLRTLRR